MMKHIKLATVLALSSIFLLMSCNKDENDDKLLVNVDAYSITKLIQGAPRSAFGYYVQANRSLKTVKVFHPGQDDEPTVLESYENSSQTFSYEPVNQDFLLNQTTSGNFLFEIESTQGEVIQQSDFLQQAPLSIPVITNTSFKSYPLTLSVSWNADTNSDGILLMMLNEQEQAIYSGPLLSHDAKEFNIRNEDGNWINPARTGDTVTIRVQSILFEEEAGISTSFLNFKTIAIGEKNIVWQE